MTRHSYMLPADYPSTAQYKKSFPISSCGNVNNRCVGTSVDYNNNTSHSIGQYIKATESTRTNPNCLNGSVCSETAYKNNETNRGIIAKSVLTKANVSSVNNCGKPFNCLSAFPCLKKTNTNSTSVVSGVNRHNNNQRYVVNNTGCSTYREPLRRVGQKQTPIQSYENIHIQPNAIHTYEPAHTIYKYAPKPTSSIDHLPTLLHANDKGLKYTYDETYDTSELIGIKNGKTEKVVGTNRPIKSYVSKPNYNGLLHLQDKKITKLENEISRNNNNAQNTFNNSLENEKLKETLLKQKQKYEETLKHVKKLEGEKRALKKNLTVRDKVLNKLEKDMSSINSENDYLLKVKDKADLSEIHNVFKYLHGDGTDLIKKKKKQNRRSKYEGESLLDSLNADDDEEEDEEEEEKALFSSKKDQLKKMRKKSILDKNDVCALKTAIVELERELCELKEENKNLNFKYENTFKTLSDLRKDTLEYMESIVSRDTRIAYMETTLQKCEKDLVKTREHLMKQKNLYESKLNECMSEIKVLEKQSGNLQEMIQEKDAQIVLLKSEIVRNETLIKQYEERNRELQSELRLMCNNLENVIEASNKKDIYMNELEKELRENEVKRQHAYLKEVARNRKVHTDLKFKEILYDKSVKNKINEVHNLKQELYVNSLHVQRAKEAYNVLKRTPKLECLVPKTTNTDYDCSPNYLDDCFNEQTLKEETKKISNKKYDYEHEPRQEKNEKMEKKEKDAKDAKVRKPNTIKNTNNESISSVGSGNTSEQNQKKYVK